MAARWFAPVPETVWIDTALSWRLDATGPKMRSLARLVKVGEPAMPRYSWVVLLRLCLFSWLMAVLLCRAILEVPL